ncbi:HPr kinase/phosphorylase [Mycoplasma anatis]|uniref:HPr kinase/phosphorylase n=1 Tax=Mycoplasmopsis anatis TaxID=171279 RepID=A0A9Q3L998_9BACT|nr:HPr(Ser) kinase/phosphatase [Mycoplasmopsis anatis]MBW0595801.1 HPr kinase/phosphorylase [Mycoplasmopsis anatis]MBW0597717.1 HPr kinase/phosphorylase [Mycoplasmopsis anatis]MBW0599511.1 HPr kinase/phosphorylase [Mycoplasmopsis anatis]MBW0600344.1 HPr kinase/phosphorylase [Mycoplasmopsis anatis]MBW0602797.1 HPr kinase/phosphorylase [Mycoplasmopsis anatis]
MNSTNTNQKRIGKSINSKKIVDMYNLDVINFESNPNFLDVKAPAIKRVGLELAQFIDNPYIQNNIISWGTTESKWFLSIGKEKTCEALRYVFKHTPPLIILSKGVSPDVIPWIVDLANEFKIPVCVTNHSNSTITTTIGSQLNSFFAEETQIHGCLVQVGGIGVLIIGQSGLGKSEATLDLIQKGNIFISDDAVLIKNIGGVVYGRSPEITRNFLEVRGIGIIDVKYTYGIRSVASKCQIQLVIELVEKNEQNSLDRLGTQILTYTILNTKIKKIRIPVKDGSNTASLIEAAVSTYLARHDGYDVIKTIESRREN